jgi:DNA-binding PadR family transcriptional regulator
METYWDVQTESAPSDVETMRYILPQFASDFSATLYDARDDTSGNEPPVVQERQLRSGQSISIDFGTEGLRLAIYTKTETRIRFEIRDYKGVRRTLGRDGDCSRLPASHLIGIEQFCRAVQLNSQRRMEAFLPTFAQRFRGRQQQPTTAKLYVFITSIAPVLRDSGGSGPQLINQLIAQGRLYKSGEPRYDRMIDELERRGLVELQSANRSAARSKKCYAPTGATRAIVTHLRHSLQSLDPAARTPEDGHLTRVQ